MADITPPLDDVNDPAKFTFKALKWYSLWMLTVYPALIVMAIALWFSKGSHYFGNVLLSLSFDFMCLMLGIIGVSFIFSHSNIIINNQGISRSLLGKTFQTIRWDNIKIIKTFFLVDPNNRMKLARVIIIYPVIRQSSDLFPFNRMRFGGNAENKSKFIELLNFYISKYNIQVEETAFQGGKTLVSDLNIQP